MATLSMTIMAHPQRAEAAHTLADVLGLRSCHIIFDNTGTVWDTGKRAWQAVDLDADYGAVIQDDAIPCRDLIPGLEEALDYVPGTGIVSGYTGTRRPMPGYITQATRTADTDGATWIKTSALNWGVLIVVPTPTIEPMLAHCDTAYAFSNYDKRVGMYYRDKLGWPTFNTWPSLVDHPDTGSLLGHGGGRVAHGFIGRDASALDLTFNDHYVTTRGTKYPTRRDDITARGQRDQRLMREQQRHAARGR